jgi:hypothetical protein
MTVFLIVIVLVLSSTVSSGIDLNLNTEIPEYITEGELNLTGNFSTLVASLIDTENSDFSGGMVRNLTIEDGTVHLKPELDFMIQNNGDPVFTGGGGSAWDRDLKRHFDIILHDGMYYMAYSAGGATLANPRHIGMAKSSDGITWTRMSTNPVLRSGIDSYDQTSLWSPILYIHNDTWHIWYGGNKGNVGGGLQDMNICYANSSDGVRWTKYSNNPVLENGIPNNAWDGIDVRPSAIMREGGKYSLYYTATGQGWGGVGSLGHASSSDGLDWVEDNANPVINSAPASWYNTKSKYGTLEKANGTYRLWSNGNAPAWKIGWVWSKDGTSWTDSGGAILQPAGGTIYSSHIMTPRVIDQGDHYKLFAMCEDNTGEISLGLFKATPMKMDGTFTSRFLDAGRVVNVVNTTWSTEFTASGELDLWFRYGNSTSAMTKWTPLKGEDDFQDIRARYFQYLAEFRVPKDWMEVRLKEFQINYEAQVDRIEVGIDGANWQEADLLGSNWTTRIALEDGEYDLHIRAIDSGGTSILKIVPIKVDLIAPEGILVLENGRNATSGTSLNYTLDVIDTFGPDQMIVSLRDDFADTAWTDYGRQGTVAYSGTDGPVKVHAKVTDPAGWMSEPVNDSIIVDTTPPEGSVVINQGAKYTRDISVNLTIDWWDLTDVVSMRVSSFANFHDAPWQAPTREMTFEITPFEGTRQVFVRLRDGVGRTATVWDTIILDTTPPDASVSINGDDEFSTSRDVVLDVNVYSDENVTVRFANEAGAYVGDWIPITGDAGLPWTLASGPDGTRTVWMVVRDEAGNEQVVRDNVILDTTAPTGTLALRTRGWFGSAADELTNDVVVDAILNASDETSGLWRFHISNSPDLSESPWQTVEPEFTWTLLEGDGDKVVYLELRDLAGNTGLIEGTTVLDTTPPSGSFIIEEGQEYLNFSDVLLHMDFEDIHSWISGARISSEAVFDNDGSAIYDSVLQWDLGAEEGLKYVYVQVFDHASNAVIEGSSVIYDATPPVITLGSPKGDRLVEGEHTFDMSVFDEWDPSPTSEWRLGKGEWRPLENETFKLNLGRGTYVIEVRSIDAAGNVQLLKREYEITIDYVVVSGWLLLIAVVAIVVAFVVWRQWMGSREIIE